MFQGIGECMTTELTSLTPSMTQFEVVASPCLRVGSLIPCVERDLRASPRDRTTLVAAGAVPPGLRGGIKLEVGAISVKPPATLNLSHDVAASP